MNSGRLLAPPFITERIQTVAVSSVRCGYLWHSALLPLPPVLAPLLPARPLRQSQQSAALFGARGGGRGACLRRRAGERRAQCYFEHGAVSR